MQQKLGGLGASGFLTKDLKGQIKDGDLQKLTNAVQMEINSMAAQLFELITLMAELILKKPKKIYKTLSDIYQTNLEISYGEHLIRQVILTKDFSFPSDDTTGQMNKEIANKTRENQQLMIELQGKEVLSTEEIQVDADEDGKSVRRKKKMECYDPIVFEEQHKKFWQKVINDDVLEYQVQA